MKLLRAMRRGSDFPRVYADPPPIPGLSRPSRAWGLWTEVAAFRQVPKIVGPVSRGILDGRRQVGDGAERVVLIPGWKSPEGAMEPLRGFLRRAGLRAEHWGFGVNEGDPEENARRLGASLADSGEPVSLVGWSLGGVVARELARHAPELVRHVVTFGTPTVGGPTYTIVDFMVTPAQRAEYERRSRDLDRTLPIQVPLTVIFTRRDGVVSWTACIDPHTPDAVHVEVGSTHVGMSLDPVVWEVVASAIGGARSSIAPS